MSSRMEPDAEPDPIDVREFMGVIRRHLVSITVFTVAFAAIGMGFVAHRAAAYSSTVEVQVRPTTTDPFEATNLLSTMSTETTLATSTPVVEIAAPELAADPRSPRQVDALLKRISVSNPSGSALLEITCSAPTAVDASHCADVWAQSYIQNRANAASAQELNNRKELQAKIAYWQGQLDHGYAGAGAALNAASAQLASLPLLESEPAIVARSATLPAGPSNKGFVNIGFLFGFVGLVLGVTIAFVRDRLKDPILDQDRLSNATEAPVLGVVPRRPRRRGNPDDPAILLSEPECPESEAYKTAASALLYVSRVRSLQVVAVVGPWEGEGKTTATANLAIALAQGGKRVVAISCDLKRPRLHRLFGLDNAIGLTAVLTGEAHRDDALLPTRVPGLFLMPSGPPSDVPDEVLLGGEAMKALLDAFRSRFDFILLDTAPALLVSDTLYLAPLTDGVVMLAEARVSSQDVRYVRDRLRWAGGHIYGAMLTMTQTKNLGDHRPYRGAVDRAGATTQPRRGLTHPRRRSSKHPDRVVSEAGAEPITPSGESRSVPVASPNSEGADRGGETPSPAVRPASERPGSER